MFSAQDAWVMSFHVVLSPGICLYDVSREIYLYIYHEEMEIFEAVLTEISFFAMKAFVLSDTQEFLKEIYLCDTQKLVKEIYLYDTQKHVKGIFLSVWGAMTW